MPQPSDPFAMVIRTVQRLAKQRGDQEAVDTAQRALDGDATAQHAVAKLFEGEGPYSLQSWNDGSPWGGDSPPPKVETPDAICEHETTADLGIGFYCLVCGLKVKR